MTLNAIRHHQFKRLRTLPASGFGELIAIMVVRDEILRLPDCLRHHRALGVDRFVVVDNGSTDGTTDYLCSQPDTDVIYTENLFAETNAGQAWRRYVVSQYGFNRWYLLIDPDELLVYDGMHEHSLAQLTASLRQQGISLLHATMIDMYRREPIGKTTFQSGDSMLAACPYFDGDSYVLEDRTGKDLSISGGPRERLMSSPAGQFTHSITKYPLVFWHRGVHTKSIHHFTEYSGLRSPSAALLHFKFLDDLGQRIEKVVGENQMWNEGVEWKAYKRFMPALKNPYYNGSRKYEGPNSLLAENLVTRIQYH